MMSIRILAIITLSLFANIVSAEIVISGHVVNEDNEPIDVATTKLVDKDGEILYFRITDENGFFEYIIEKERLDATLIVECLGYGAIKKNVTTSHDITNMTIILTCRYTRQRQTSPLFCAAMSARSSRIRWLDSKRTEKATITVR